MLRVSSHSNDTTVNKLLYKQEHRQDAKAEPDQQMLWPGQERPCKKIYLELASARLHSVQELLTTATGGLGNAFSRAHKKMSRTM